MARYRLPSLSPNVKAYFSHFGKPILIVLGILVVVGLSWATYVYGNKKHDQSHQEQSQQTASSSNQPTSTANQNQTNSGSAASPTNTAPTASNPQPTNLADTGPGDWSLLIIVSLCILFSLHLRARRALASALQTV